MNSLKEQYDQISKQFSQSRKKALWPELITYLDKLKPGQRILDMGAGSGRLLRAVPEKIEYIGVDISPGMLEEARRDFPQANFFEANILDGQSLDYLGQFDYVFVIAVAHHLDEKELEKLFLSIKNRLKPDGIAVISCWKLFSKKFFFAHVKQIFNKIKNYNWRFIEIPFCVSNGQKVSRFVNRTCYVYDILKLNKMARKMGLKINNQSKSKSNIWLECSRDKS